MMPDYVKTAEMIRVCSLKKRIFCSGCVKEDGDDGYHCAIDDAANAIEELLAELVTIRNQLPRQTIETNIFDIEEVHPDCTVQILRNSVTGETSIGWWPNDNKPIGTKEGN